MLGTSNTKGSVNVAALAVVLVTMLLVLSPPLEAEPQLVTLEGVSFNANSSMAENLRSFVGKRVSVTLDCGKTFGGTVKDVGDHLVHLEKLDGREYFDALI